MTSPANAREPQTAAGKQAVANIRSGVTGLYSDDPVIDEMIWAVEQSAVAAAMTRVRAAVKGVSLPPGPDFAWVDGHKPFIAAVLAAIDAEGAR